MTSYAKPESVVAKANELVLLGKVDQALENLKTIFSKNRQYRIWVIGHEQAAIKYLELAIVSKHKKFRNVKEVMNNFRQICQTASPDHSASLEKVLIEYLRLVNLRTQEAQDRFNQLNGSSGKSEFIEDLEECPESILARAQSMNAFGPRESSADKAGLALINQSREDLTQWVKYLWETYRTVLEILRGYDKLQEFYHLTFQNCFSFCVEYKRTYEFRKLCEILRQDVSRIEKYQAQPNCIDLKSAETRDFYLRTRYQQLKAATELEQWQQAYATVEEIHTSFGGRAPQKTKLVSTYWEKIAQIFWSSDNYLFHAIALWKLYEYSASELSAVEKTDIASAVTLATLIIPSEFAFDDCFDPQNESNSKLANLLGFKEGIPTRSRLLNKIKSEGLFSTAYVPYQQMVELLESSFSPLTMKNKLGPVLDSLRDSKVSPTLSKYVAQVETTAVLRLLLQLSVVFKTIKVSRFLQLCPCNVTMPEVERLVIDSNSRGVTRIRFDHRNQLIHFADDDMNSERMPNQLVKLSEKLENIVAIIKHPTESSQVLKKKERERVFKSVTRGMNEDHRAVTKRLADIEKRKKELEEQQEKKKRQETRLKDEEEQKKLNEQRTRTQQEADEREKIREKKNKEAAEAQLKARKEADEARRATELAAAATTDKQRSDQLKDLDYFTRALRIEEKPLLLAYNEKKRQEDKEQADAEYQSFVKESSERHAKIMEDKKCLIRMLEGKAEFDARVRARRQAKLDVLMSEYEGRVERWTQEQNKKEAERKQKEDAEREKIAREEAQREAEKERVRKEQEEMKARKLKEDLENDRQREEAVRKQREYEDQVAAREAQRRAEREERERKEGEERERTSRRADELDWGKKVASVPTSQLPAQAGPKRYVPPSMRSAGTVNGSATASASSVPASSASDEKLSSLRDKSSQGELSVGPASSRDEPVRTSQLPAQANPNKYVPRFMRQAVPVNESVTASASSVPASAEKPSGGAYNPAARDGPRDGYRTDQSDRSGSNSQEVRGAELAPKGRYVPPGRKSDVDADGFKTVHRR